MNVAFQHLVQHLDDREINYVANSDEQSVSTNIAGEVGQYRIYAQVPEASDLFELFGFSPVRVPGGARPAIAEVIARANHGLRVGSFSLDFDNGELTFHMGQVLNDVGLDADIVDWMICTTMALLDKYLPAILSVIYGNETPGDAIRRIEAGCCGEEGVG
ncbi:MAG TPA: YbjN domain-containing protein [Pirellulales bacterium]|jgi:hypothetical protein|nr:YbjN domain-containing protein [Pirellulales bacterium]